MKQARRTKIVCTIGPAVSNPAALKEMMQRGMNCARLNFSHGDHEEHLGRVTMLKAIREELGLHVALMLDTKGPEIRTKGLEAGKVDLVTGESFTLYCNEFPGDQTGVSVTYENLSREVVPGTRILIDDGLIELLVREIAGEKIHCVVVNGGQLGSKKSINLPDVSINLPAITEQDEGDIIFACKNDFDFVAASFVRKASDVEAIRRVLKGNGGEDIKIISKIENQEGVNNAIEIIEASDGIMVARGDLGVEIPAEEVPIVQKMLIAECVRRGKPVITATQMLDSMIKNPRPTRAEVSDVANAVFDGTSCVMLSGETANGKYPLEALSTMARIAERADRERICYIDNASICDGGQVAQDTVSYATFTTANSVGAKAIITVTSTGITTRMASRFRPDCPIVAVTANPKVMRQLAISWGVVACLGDTADSTDKLFEEGVEKAVEMGIVQAGDQVVITAGLPVGEAKTTNVLKVHTV
ncbi:MAG: pyruvate kinase [Oscillospiraceae bacterium]|nr:pyruvate kinase [Oscillospiraceae bacterium]